MGVYPATGKGTTVYRTRSYIQKREASNFGQREATREEAHVYPGHISDTRLNGLRRFCCIA